MEQVNTVSNPTTDAKTIIISKLNEVYNDYLDAYVDPHQPGDFIATDEFNAFRFHMQAIERIIRCK